MKNALLKDMVGGWFIGGFKPSVLNSEACEVAVKKYLAGANEEAHYHAIATEVTVIVSGRVRMFGREWSDGDIIVIEPNEVTAFEAITNVVTVVVKIPGVLNDKFVVQN